MNGGVGLLLSSLWVSNSGFDGSEHTFPLQEGTKSDSEYTLKWLRGEEGCRDTNGMT